MQHCTKIMREKRAEIFDVRRSYLFLENLYKVYDNVVPLAFA